MQAGVPGPWRSLLSSHLDPAEGRGGQALPGAVHGCAAAQGYGELLPGAELEGVQVWRGVQTVTFPGPSPTLGLCRAAGGADANAQS